MITRTWNLLDSIAFLADAVDIILVKSRCFQIDYSFNDQQGGVIIFFSTGKPIALRNVTGVFEQLLCQLI